MPAVVGKVRRDKRRKPARRSTARSWWKPQSGREKREEPRTGKRKKTTESTDKVREGRERGEAAQKGTQKLMKPETRFLGEGLRCSPERTQSASRCSRAGARTRHKATVIRPTISESSGAVSGGRQAVWSAHGLNADVSRERRQDESTGDKTNSRAVRELGREEGQSPKG